MPTPARRGRPAGLAANPDAFADALGERSQRWLAAESEMSVSHLSEILAGRKGVTEPQARHLADILGKRPGTLFPQLVTFKVEVRSFTVNGVEAA
jgi:hypothetical protein